VSEEGVERKLTTILVADVVGYSRLMGADEARTLAVLKSDRKVLIDPKAAQYGGRTVKLMGDGALMEFASVVDAVAFAVEVQCAMQKRNADFPEDKQIRYRVGINIGDIIVEDDDIFGDGVNVAARLEGLAEAGGICVSRNVFDQVKDKLDLTFEHLGDKDVKNIAEPVSVYRVVFDDKAAALVTPIVEKATKQARWHLPFAAAAVVLLVAVGGVIWWRPWAPEFSPAQVLPLPDKPSIAVLAFDNLSGDPKQEYLSDGISEAIITGLSKFPELFVIARKSSFSYKGKAVKVQQMAEELGVHYILEGSVQRSDDRIRVTGQLIDATTGRHLWAQQYDRQWEDIFALQDDITQHIVANIVSFEGPLEEATRERAKQKAPADLRAYDYLLLGRAHFFLVTKKENARARELFHQAVELDSNYSLGHTWLSWTHNNDAFFGWSDTPAASSALALEHARKAVELNNAEAGAHWALGSALMNTGKQPQVALAAYERAFALNPNNADLMAEFGWILPSLGRAEEAVEFIEKAMRLNPIYPDWYGQALMFALYNARRYREVIAVADTVRVRHLRTHLVLAGSHAQLGQLDDARQSAAKALEIQPDFSLGAWRERQKFVRPADLEHYFEGLRKAGLPD
jgi:adenylate cyclase